LPENTGSGKPGTPWLRMQAENFSACRLALLGIPPPSGPAPLGISFAHVRCADWNDGEEGSIALPGPPWMTSAPPPFAVACGSGKPGTPCVRMHSEYLTIAW
jgi:hypothetical protein